MCLAIAYELRGDEKVTLCEHVSGIELAPGTVRLSGLMGKDILVEGSLERIDLMKNEIVILPKE